MTAPDSLKRSRTAADQTFNRQNETTKKAKLETVVGCCLAQAIFHTDYSRAQGNKVYLSSSLFERVFQLGRKEGDFLKVDNLVFRAYHDQFLVDPQMDLNRIAYDDISSNLTTDLGCIQISPFILEKEPIAPIESIHFEVCLFGTQRRNFAKKGPITVQKQSILDQIALSLCDNILKVNQSLFINHSEIGPLKITVDRWSRGDPIDFKDAGCKFIPYGLFTKDTIVSVSSGDSFCLSFIDEFDPNLIDRFLFAITNVKDVSERTFSLYSSSGGTDSWKNDIQPLPLPMPLDEVVSKIKQKWLNTRLQIGDKEKFLWDQNWQFEIELLEVTALPVANKSDDEKLKSKSKKNEIKQFPLCDKHIIKIQTPPEQQILITQPISKGIIAEELKFEIIGKEINPFQEENEMCWLSIEDVIREIRNCNRQLIEDGKSVIKVNGGKYLIQLRKAFSTSLPIENNSLKKIWLVGEKTEIKVFKNAKLNLQLVDASKPLPLKSVKISVSVADKGSKFPTRISLLGSHSDEDGPKKNIKEDELRKVLLQLIPRSGLLLDKQVINGISDKGDEIKFTFESFIPLQSGKAATPEHGHLYQFTPETTLIFDAGKKSNISITSTPKQIDFHNIHDKLLDLGIGGMKSEFRDFLVRMIMGRTLFSDHIKNLNQKQSCGLLLYGLPGTGKTLIARKMGEILGIPKDKIQLITGSEIWDKYVGESEKKIKGLFKNAHEDQKLYGSESPLHLLVIDEIDAFLGERAKAQRRYETSVVDAFLSELDGISSQGGESLRNMIVVGLTNHLESIDEAAKRPGRLFPHFHVDIPNQEGRKEIFDIHSKEIREQGFLGPDVDVEKIVKLTVGRSGAFIEALIATAASHSLRRLCDNAVAPGEIKNSPVAKLTMQDFLNAYSECIEEKKSENMDKFIPSIQTDIEGVLKDLKTLKIGGVNSEAAKFISDLKIYQKYQGYFHAMKQPFHRGLLLYGPQDTGKSALARSFKDMFDLKDKQFQYLQMSELWPLQGWQLQEKIKTLLQPAMDASKDLEHEAPLHVIVIDELENLFSHRQQAEGDSLPLNRLMKELQPLFNEEDRELHNLVVIGISRCASIEYFNSLPKTFSFGKNIKMELPTMEGRKEILEIYLKEYIERHLLKVDLKELVPLTEEMTGAQIKNFVMEAILKGMRRVASLGLEPTNFEMVENDFIAAKEALGIVRKASSMFG